MQVMKSHLATMPDNVTLETSPRGKKASLPRHVDTTLRRAIRRNIGVTGARVDPEIAPAGRGIHHRHLAGDPAASEQISVPTAPEGSVHDMKCRHLSRRNAAIANPSAADLPMAACVGGATRAWLLSGGIGFLPETLGVEADDVQHGMMPTPTEWDNLRLASILYTVGRPMMPTRP